MPACKRIAYWMSEKKLQKINWDDFKIISKKYGYELFKLDLARPLQEQEPFHVILHKLTDIIASANQGDVTNMQIINSLENYISEHNELVVLDPIDKVRQLLNRFQCYSIIQTTDLYKFNVFTPNFCELRTTNTKLICDELISANINYPFICKPQLGHGSRKAHEMLIIFNETNLRDCNVPCVVQSFINHNAILYKMFIVGEQYYYVERPSLKNFYPSDCESIAFDSSVVSKAGAQSDLSVLEPHEHVAKIIPKNAIFDKIAFTLRMAFRMDLLGVDVVIENGTGRYFIIDVNAYPGYDGFPNLYEALLKCIDSKLNKKRIDGDGGDDNNEAKRKHCDRFDIPQSITHETHSIITSLY